MPANLKNSAVATELEKVSFHSKSKKGNAKECPNYCTIVLISHTSKVMLKILQVTLQQDITWELPDVQAGTNSWFFASDSQSIVASASVLPMNSQSWFPLSIILPTKVRLVKAMVFPVVMSELDYKESWVPKNWCFWTVVLEKILESSLYCKEIKPVSPRGNQSPGKTDAEAETPVLWPPDVENWLIGKDPDAGKAWRQEEKEMTGWDGWMASPTQWTLVWANSRRWWWTGRPGVLWFMGSQRVRYEWVTETY